MNKTLADLRARMEAAAAAMDFEEAARLRDQYATLRGAADPDAAGEVDTSRLTRQQPGSMGLGTSDQVFKPPPGWRPPKKPDPMTAGRKPGGGRRR
jgi:hypothetical protein